jgi:MerR family mercuric resistance operon transcriptional regulator
MVARSKKPLLIGGVAERTGVNIETIRYYERVGLLPHPPRTGGRRRTYDEASVRLLDFVRRGRELGFSLAEVRTLLELADRGAVACAETKDMSVRHLADVRGKIRSLKKLERTLKKMTDACQPGTQLSCPILDALGADGVKERALSS